MNIKKPNKKVKSKKSNKDSNIRHIPSKGFYFEYEDCGCD